MKPSIALTTLAGAAAMLATVAPSAVADTAEPRVGALRRGVQLDLGLGALVIGGTDGTEASVATRVGLRVDRRDRWFGKLGWRLKKFESDASPIGGALVDVGVGLRTRRRAGVVAGVAIGGRVGVIGVRPDVIGRVATYTDGGQLNRVEQLPSLAPEVSATMTWWRTRVIGLGVYASYAPTPVDGELVHLAEALLTIAVAI